jgi:hypothetical protein
LCQFGLLGCRAGQQFSEQSQLVIRGTREAREQWRPLFVRPVPRDESTEIKITLP